MKIFHDLLTYSYGGFKRQISFTKWTWQQVGISGKLNKAVDGKIRARSPTDIVLQLCHVPRLTNGTGFIELCVVIMLRLWQLMTIHNGTA